MGSKECHDSELPIPVEVSTHNDNQVEFEAGRLKSFVSNWQQLTSGPFIIEMVTGAKMPLNDMAQVESLEAPKNQVQANLLHEADQEIEKLLHMKVIQKAEHEEGEVISPIFLVPKPDGSYRMILNLKQFNEGVEYEHFKMENLTSATNLMKKGCFLGSVDLRWAYYSVPIHAEFTKCLKFQWRGQLYAYTCFPNGLANCPRYFTKLLKSVYGYLRSRGLLSAAFIDDCYLQGQSYDDCKQNSMATVELFEKLGFVIHSEKSVFEPTKKLTYLGFILNSADMTVTLSEAKQSALEAACLSLKERNWPGS